MNCRKGRPFSLLPLSPSSLPPQSSWLTPFPTLYRTRKCTLVKTMHRAHFTFNYFHEEKKKFSVRAKFPLFSGRKICPFREQSNSPQLPDSSMHAPKRMKYVFLHCPPHCRKIALVIILTRAGLDLDPIALRRLKVTVPKLGLIPWLAEATVIAVMTRYLLDLPWVWGFLLGSIIAAVSPAVVVPCLFRLRSRGYGVAKVRPLVLSPLLEYLNIHPRDLSPFIRIRTIISLLELISPDFRTLGSKIDLY